MDYSVEWLPQAIADVDALAAFIASDSSAYASAFVQKLLLRSQRLSDFPLKGRVVPEWNEESVREIFVGSYRLIYRVETRRILVLTVIHGARLLPDFLKDRR